MSEPETLMASVHKAMRERHYATTTEDAYTKWIRRFIEFNGTIHPIELQATHLQAFKDLDFDGSQIVVGRGKGKKDRVTLFPFAIREPLRRHLVQIRKQHERDLQTGAGYVYIPHALRTKYPDASRERRWHWVFPATRQYRDEETGELRRHHLHETVVQKAVSAAVKTAGIAKPASCQSLRNVSP